jgi:hypothetical protein
MLQNDIEFLARADMIKRNIDKKSGMVSMIPIRISLIEECAANEVTEIRVHRNSTKIQRLIRILEPLVLLVEERRTGL